MSIEKIYKMLKKTIVILSISSGVLFDFINLDLETINYSLHSSRQKTVHLIQIEN